jgi:phosphonate transport system substrate-binding protein
MKAVSLFLILCFSLNVYAESEPVNSGEKPLTLGFFPVISTVALYKRFSPLRDYLTLTLGHEVLLQTAKDFPTFTKRTAERQYDIVVTAPHFAVSASDSGLYKIRATLIKDVQQLIVVNKDSSITDVAQLAGKNIATPPDDALMTIMGKQFLKEAGLTGDKAPKFRAFTSHNAANQALMGHEVDAVIGSSNIIKKAIDRGDSLKIIARGQSLPNMALLVATDKDDIIGNQIVKALVDMKKSEKGNYVLNQINFPGYREVTAKDYEPARPYLELALEMSKQ